MIQSDLRYYACDLYTKFMYNGDVLYLHYAMLLYDEYKLLGGDKSLESFLNGGDKLTYGKYS